MKSAQVAVIKAAVVEGRRFVQDTRWRYVSIRLLGLKARLLEHPSTPFHYVTLQAVTRGARGSQKIEIVKTGGFQIWKCTIDEMIHRWVSRKWQEELASFLDRVGREEIDQVWLDTDFTFPRSKSSNWRFVYKSIGTFDHYQGEGRVFHRGVHVYTGFCQGTITRDLSKRPPATR